MSDQQLTLAGSVTSGETIEATGIWLSVLQLVNTLDDEATLYLKGDTLPPDSPAWETSAVTIPAVVQQVEVPMPANGAIEAGVMIVPDPGSSLAVDHGHRVALPPPRDGKLPVRAATQYATIRNIGDSPTTVSLIYTYQQETLNPGRGDLLGSDMARVDLGVGEQVRLGGSISGLLSTMPRALLELDQNGVAPARLTKPSSEYLADTVWEPDGGIRISAVVTDRVWYFGSFDRESPAQRVEYAEPTSGQTILTDLVVEGQPPSTLTVAFRPIEWVDVAPRKGVTYDTTPDDKGSRLQALAWEFRGKPKVGSELTDWSHPSSFPDDDNRLRVGTVGRPLDWYYDVSWIPALQLGDEEPTPEWASLQGCRRRWGCLWWLIFGGTIFGAGFVLWLVLSGNGEDDIGSEPISTTTVIEPSSTTATVAPITTTTEVITLLDAFAAWGSPADVKMAFMGTAWGWSQSDAERIANNYMMRAGDIELKFSNLDEEPGKDNDEVKLESSIGLTVQLDAAFRFFNFGNTTFECDTMVDGRRTVCASPEVPPEGELLMFIAHLGDEIPVETLTGESYTYGLVFESDGDPSNDYVAQPPFLGDTFQGTDYWFELYGWEGEDERTWSLEVTDVANEDFRGSTPSTARVVIWGDMIFWYIPASEIPDYTGWRFTSFVTDTANPFQAAGSAVDAVPGFPDWDLFDPPDIVVSPTGAP